MESLRARKEAEVEAASMARLKMAENDEEVRRRLFQTRVGWYLKTICAERKELVKAEVYYPYVGRMLEIPNPEVPWHFKRRAGEGPVRTVIRKRTRHH